MKRQPWSLLTISLVRRFHAMYVMMIETYINLTKNIIVDVWLLLFAEYRRLKRSTN
jgi:hypothetical protein